MDPESQAHPRLLGRDPGPGPWVISSMWVPGKTGAGDKAKRSWVVPQSFFICSFSIERCVVKDEVLWPMPAAAFLMINNLM